MAEYAFTEHFGAFRSLASRQEIGIADDGPSGDLPPIRIRIGDSQQDAQDWTMTGFGLAVPIAGLRMQDVRNARIEVRISDFDIRFAIPVQVAAATVHGATRFTFLGAFTEQARLLHRLVEDCRAGHATRFETLLASPPIRKRSNRSFRLTDYVAVGSLAAAAVVLAVVVATSLLTVRSRVAAVTMDGSVLRAPATGIVAGRLVPVGSQVRKDQPLFRLIDPALAIRAAEASGELRRLDVVLDHTRTRFAELQHVTHAYGRLTEQRLDALKSRIGALDSQISIYARLVDKKQLLAGKGAGSNVSADLEQINLEGRRQEREQAEEAHATAIADAELLRSGILSLDRRPGHDTVESLRLQVSEIEAAIARTQATLDAIRGATVVASPCDCTVYALLAKAGEIVEAGMPVTTLRASQGAPLIEALFEAEDISGVTVGSSVSVSLAGRRMQGRLENLSFDEQPQLRVGLASPARSPSTTANTQPTMVKAMISLADPSAAALVGMPGEVAMLASPLRRTLNRLAALRFAL